LGALSLTLSKLIKCGYDNLEIIVVDNNSTDGTRKFIEKNHQDIILVCLEKNLGAQSRNIGAEKSKGEFIVMLDSDSYPIPGTISKMVKIFQSNHKMGAIAFRNILPEDGGRDEVGGSYNVFVGCGVGFRREVFEKAGGYPKGYQFYVEEYDLSYRILNQGYSIRFFKELVVYHHKAPQQRDFGKIIYFLVRNNIYLYLNYFPFAKGIKTLRWVVYRYFVLAKSQRCFLSALKGALSGFFKSTRSMLDRTRLFSTTLDQVVPERFCEITFKKTFGRQPPKNILLWGIGKDFAAFVNGAGKMGITIKGACPTSSQPYFSGRKKVLGVRILNESELFKIKNTPILIASSSPGEIENEISYLNQEAISLWVVSLFRYEE